LSTLATSRRGSISGIAGMVIALLATIFGPNCHGIQNIIMAMAIGGTIGLIVARKIEMTKVPDFIALLHSFVGLAAAFVGFNSYLENHDYGQPLLQTIHLTEICLGVGIGALTFVGSVIAFCKLRAIMSTRPIILPYSRAIRIGSIIAANILTVIFIHTSSSTFQILSLMAILFIAVFFGWQLVASIGGADMPVVISVLNSYSGWASAAAGFMLENDLLIVTGALVGSSGAILSHIMCKAMNRSLMNVLSGGSSKDIVKSGGRELKPGEHQEIDGLSASHLLSKSRSVVIVPGYGMAVSQAQKKVAAITEKLQSRGTKVKFAVHPVAGRLPGHMNVLLAEANISYDIVFEMDEINDQLENTDTILVIGANDTVNPSAMDDPNSPIAGMPVLKVWNANDVIVIKRSMSPGYAGVENPLFFKGNTHMLFGDAKTVLQSVLDYL
jgi:NAD(P) transhydrogenase subunit beta